MLVMDIISFGKAEETLLNQFEKQIGFSLPEDYRIFLRNCNGGMPEIKYAAFFIKDLDDYSSLDVLLGLNVNKFDLIRRNIEYKDDLVPNSVIIGDDPGGSMIVLISDDNHSGIYFWDHSFDYEQSNEEHNIYKIANSFGEFINNLIDPESI
jgi:hypothetical protein